MSNEVPFEASVILVSNAFSSTVNLAMLSNSAAVISCVYFSKYRLILVHYMVKSVLLVCLFFYISGRKYRNICVTAYNDNLDNSIPVTLWQWFNKALSCFNMTVPFEYKATLNKEVVF